MSDSQVLLSALRELLARCSQEVQEASRRSIWPLDAAVDEHMKTAERALARLARAADIEQCSVIAREVLSAVAHVRNCLQGDLTRRPSA